MNAVISWSGGKDCCLALYKALASGIHVTHMINFVKEDKFIPMPPCLRTELVRAQAAALRLPLIQQRIDRNTYENGFRVALKELKLHGVNALINGDVYLPEGITWNRKMCRELGLNLIMPLENAAPERLLTDFINAGFEAIIICVNTGTPARDWLGEKIDISFLARLYSRPDSAMSFYGELGEFHTLVTDGPIFAERIEIQESHPVDIDGYSYLDITRFETRPKQEVRHR